jgi:hypothetical protein
MLTSNIRIDKLKLDRNKNKADRNILKIDKSKFRIVLKVININSLILMILKGMIDTKDIIL